MSLVYDAAVAYDAFYSYLGGSTVGDPVVAIAGLFFSGAPDEDGVEWIVEDLAEWDSADVRATSAPRPQDDGLWLPTFLLGGRTIEVNGIAIAPSKEVAYTVKNRLALAMNLLASEATLTVTEDRARQASVRRSDKLLMRQLGPTVEFTIPLRRRTRGSTRARKQSSKDRSAMS